MPPSALPDFFDWFQSSGMATRPWLVLGKGPSFSRLEEFDTRNYLRIGLNHAVRECRVDLAHIVDVDVIAACGEALIENAGRLVVPWHPHVANVASEHTLEHVLATQPILRHLHAQGRLLTYNLRSGRKHGHREGHAEVPVRFFSFEAAFNLLAMGGVRRIRSLGVDGGTAYSPRFSDLNDKTLLANGRASFDQQFDAVVPTVHKYGVDYAPLDAETPIQVFVATTEDQMLSVQVLEHSIRRYSTMPVQLTPLHRCGIEVPTPKAPKNYPRTPFSFQRFLIPQVRGYQGRAIYLDSDMQVFSDIRALWVRPMNGAQLLAVGDTEDASRAPQFSVMLLDCARLDWNLRMIVDRLDSGTLEYAHLMRCMAVAERIEPTIPPQWNALEHYEPGRTALLHYTDMPTQPWVSTSNPLGYLWVRELFDAVDSGAVQPGLIEQHIAQSWVRPSLAWQLEHRMEDPLLLPRKALALDRGFEPPYARLPAHQRQSPPRPAKWLRTKRRMQALVGRHPGDRS